MKVKDLIELNAMITDLEITVRLNGNTLLDQLNIGCSEGVIPPYPTRVPTKEEYAGSLAQHTDKYKDAAYIPKSINAWDDGKDYYEISPGPGASPLPRACAVSHPSALAEAPTVS